MPRCRCSYGTTQEGVTGASTLRDRLGPKLGGMEPHGGWQFQTSASVRVQLTSDDNHWCQAASPGWSALHHRRDVSHSSGAFPPVVEADRTLIDHRPRRFRTRGCPTSGPHPAEIHDGPNDHGPGVNGVLLACIQATALRDPGLQECLEVDPDRGAFTGGASTEPVTPLNATVAVECPLPERPGS